MRWIWKVCFVVLAPGLLLAQANTQNAGSSSATSVEDDLKALRDAMTQQQQQLAQQQQRMAQQKQRIETLKQALADDPSSAPHVQDVALNNNTPATAAPAVRSETQQPETPHESPLSFRIGAAEFTPGGFVDFENVFRTTNTGGVSSTSFGAIPFNNTVQGHLTEFRSTGQYSRYSLKVTDKFGANNVTGYIEGDFNGNDALNALVTSNPHTGRLRLYWLDLKRGKWEFLGGQSWGLETPNRTGVSPNPADLAITYGEDANVHVGIPYTRAATFRMAYHPTDNFVWAFSIQNPQQFVGVGEVILPFVFNAQLGLQVDPGNNPGTPNAAPNFLTKMAYDHGAAGSHFHVEVGGLLNSAKVSVFPVGGTSFVHHSNLGASFFGAGNVDLGKHFRLLANGFWGQGGGRYIIGLGPDFVVRPNAAGNDVDVSMVHSGTGLAGIEIQAGPKSIFGFYYGGAYFQRNLFCDTSSPGVGTCAGKPFGGFGGPVNVSGANRSVQEASFDWTQTFWRNPQYGAIYLVNQLSYVTRAPWFVPLGAPKNAHLVMGYVSLRYQLP